MYQASVFYLEVVNIEVECKVDDDDEEEARDEGVADVVAVKIPELETNLQRIREQRR